MEAVVRFFGRQRGPARTHFHYLTLHGTRPLNICSRCSATNHVFRLSITWFSVFLKVTFVCNGVSGNGNACAQAACREPKMCKRFAIGLTQQLPHLSNILLCSMPVAVMTKIFLQWCDQIAYLTSISIGISDANCANHFLSSSFWNIHWKCCLLGS